MKTILLSFLTVVLLPAILTAGEPVVIRCAGATFPYPLYVKWFDDFQKIDGNVEFEYQPVGSKKGLEKLLEGAADIAASDAPVRDKKDLLVIPAAS